MKKNYILTLLMTICMTVASYGQYSDLFISMYAEGSSNNKFIEIYNGTGSSIDLSNYMIKGTNNGGNWKEARNLNLTGSITDGDVYVIATDQSDASILAVADLSLSYESALHYNGDDAIALLKKNDSDTFEVIDIVGATGDDPGSGWAVAGVTNATKDHTLTRKNTISGPSSDWTSSAGTDESSSEWVVTGIDTEWTSLGSYQAAVVASTDPSDDFEGNGNITWKADANIMNTSFDNPASGGINTSAKVLEYSDEGGTYSNIQFDLSTDTSVKYDLSTKNVFTLKVYVPTPSVAVTQSKILWLKLQDGSKGANSWQGQVVKEQAYEYDVWQELTFDFSSIASNTDMSRLVIQFNGENNNEHVKAYIDDISYGEGDGTVVEPPADLDPSDDFEGNGNITWKADANIMNASFDNPAPGGINTSAKVLEYSDEGGTYSNIQFDLSTDTSVKYDLSTKNVFTLKVYVPTPSVAVTQSKILWLKLQDGSKGANSWQGQVVKEQAYEYDVWQELTFDFSSIASNTDMSRLVIQFNGENNNEHVKAYIDDISYGEGDGTVVEPPADLDPSDDFEGNGNITWKADANIMNASFDNPAPGGINTSAKVLEYSDEGGTYSNIQFDLSTDTSVKYDLSTKNVFTLKVYVPTPSVAVTQSKILWLKLQDGSKGGNSWQGQVVKEQAYEYDVWQELTFDFSSIASNTDMSRLVIQFNGENNNEHVKAYIDDISYGEAATASTIDNALLNISMYPNPASSRLTISAQKTINSAAIYNILGKQVMSLEINKNSESIDVSNLATGMYLIKYSIDNAVGTAKFIKQ